MDFSKLKALIDTKKSEIDAKRTTGVNAAKIPAGSSRWRILPGWRDTDRATFSHRFGQHWIKDGAGHLHGVYVCERETFGRDCDICDVVADAIRTTKDDDALKILKEMKSKVRVLVNAICIQGPKADPNNPVLLEVAPTVEDAFVNALHTFYIDDVNILSLDEGHDIIVDKQGTGMNTKYQVTVAPKSTKVDPSVMDRVVNIDDWIANEFKRSQQRGTKPLNDGVAKTLGIAAPPSGGLVSGGGWTGKVLATGAAATIPAAASAAAGTPALANASYDASELDAALAGDTIPPFDADSAPAATAPVKERPVAAPVKDDDLEALLATL